MSQPETAAPQFHSLFISISLPVLLSFVEQTITAAALPAIAADFNDLGRAAWTIVAYLAAVAIAAPVYGKLGDAYGRRRLLMVSLAISAVGALCCSLAGSVEMLIAARVLQGLGGGGLMTLAQALISEAVGARERARYQGYLATTAVTGSSLGPIVGGLMTGAFGWRSIFLVSLPVIAVAMVLVLRLPARRSPHTPLRLDWIGLILMSVAVAGLLLAIELVRRSGTDAALSLILLAVSGAAFVALAWWEHRAAEPIIPPDLIRNPVIWRGDVLAMCQGGVMVALLTFTPIYLRAGFGVEPTEIGLLMLPMSVCLGIGAWGTGQMVSRTGRTTLFPMVGLSIAALLLCGLTLLLGRLSLWGLAFYMALLAASLGTVMAVVQVVVQSSAGPRRFGTAAANVQLARSIGSALGTTITASVILGVAGLYDDGAALKLQGLIQGVVEGAAPMAGTAVRQALDGAFGVAFLVLAGFALLGVLIAWRLPLRRL